MPFASQEMYNAIQSLVTRYSSLRERYITAASQYSEADVRADFIDPFFVALGWDLQNQRGLPQRFREVVRETRVNVDENTKKPDYEFKLGAERKFFVEAKKPLVNISNHIPSAYQVKRYGWSANLPISVLMNFEYLAIYDTTTQPSVNDPVNSSRRYIFRYDGFLANLERIAELLSHSAVYNGHFDALLQTGIDRQVETVDDFFLDVLNRWRISLAQDIINTNPTIDRFSLNEIVQRFILRVLFLRMVEDRGIQNYQQLLNVANANDWNGFLNLFREANNRFDSELFTIQNDPFFRRGQNVIRLNSDRIRELIRTLYYPYAPYTFSVFDPLFLGNIYERFLDERIVNVEGMIELQQKPENVDRDVVPTPTPIIERIVQQTITPLVSDAAPENILNLKILDPACGSGGFLIAAFSLLNDGLVEAYRKGNMLDRVYETEQGFFLPFETKKALISQCLFGVDRDYFAVEVARFSLVVKLLENETADSLPHDLSLLPSLSNNIVFGDSLIDNRILLTNPDADLIGVPITWGDEIICPFDAVIGNPPYMTTEAMVNHEPVEYEYYRDRNNYFSSYKQFDKYFLFIEQSLKLWLNQTGLFGMLVSRKFSHIGAGKNLRRLISRGRHLIGIIDFGNAQLFTNRITYTCILLLSKSGTPEPQNEEEDIIDYELVTSPSDWLSGISGNGSNQIKLPRWLVSGESAWILPSTKEELQLVKSLTVNTTPLGELFDVINGIQTSRNPVYVISQWRDIDANTISFEKYGETWQIERGILKPFFESDDQRLLSFHPLPSTSLIIFPYQITEDDEGELHATLIPPGVMQTTYPGAYRWLEHNRDDLLRRDIWGGKHCLDTKKGHCKVGSFLKVEYSMA